MWESLLPSKGVWSMQGDEIDHLHQNTAWAHPSAAPALPGALCWRKRGLNVHYNAAKRGGETSLDPSVPNPPPQSYSEVFYNVMGRHWIGYCEHNVMHACPRLNDFRQCPINSDIGKPADLAVFICHSAPIDLYHLQNIDIFATFVVLCIFNSSSDFPTLIQKLPCFSWSVSFCFS